MVSHSFELWVDGSDGALPRLLGLVERRGFEVVGMDLRSTPGASERRLTLTVRPREPHRRIETLTLQIDRLFDVRRAEPVLAASEAA